jgi:hypothetical protein
MYHAFEPTLYPAQVGDPVRAQLIDEDNDTRTCEVMADWIQLHQYDNRHDFGDLPGRIILDWDQMGRPALPGHDEITSTVIHHALENIEDGDIFAAESYMLCAAICEATNSNHSPEVKETAAYNDLFAAIKTVVEMEGGDL